MLNTLSVKMIKLKGTMFDIIKNQNVSSIKLGFIILSKRKDFKKNETKIQNIRKVKNDVKMKWMELGW